MDSKLSQEHFFFIKCNFIMSKYIFSRTHHPCQTEEDMLEIGYVTL
jgi:hypothetical protein